MRESMDRQTTLPLRNYDDRQQSSTKGSFCVTADLLIPGRGKPQKNACIVIEDSKISHVGPIEDVKAHFAHLSTTHVKVLMPGMWDCHAHLLGITRVSSEAILGSQQSPVLSGARLARDCELLINAGFTSVREMAGYGLQLAKAIEESSLIGPNIYSSNCIISPTGGHADVHDLHRDWFDDACSHGLPMALADGVADCMKVVRSQLRAGAHVIKICGSGGVGSELDNPIDQQFSDEEMKIIVEEAARARRVVGAHCHGKLGIMAALNAGVRTIEHGSYLDEEVADLMLEKGAMLVATRTIIEVGLKLGKGVFTERGYEKLLVVAKAHEQAMKLAVKKGVTMATGCDLAGSVPGSSVLSYGTNGQELGYHVLAGMTELQAIEAATANGPATLGPYMAPKSGQLKEGYDADFIALDANPLDDISILHGSEHIQYVWKHGKCYKAPGHPVSSLVGAAKKW